MWRLLVSVTAESQKVDQEKRSFIGACKIHLSSVYDLCPLLRFPLWKILVRTPTSTYFTIAALYIFLMLP